MTVDTFLMGLLNVRNLRHWLDRRRSDMNGLRRLATERAIKRTDERLFFVDEYGLLEGSLADLLNVVLRDARCVVVGDCNQQSAIDDRSDRPIRTMLGYECVCFMYDNVRTNDPELLRRMSYFAT